MNIIKLSQQAGEMPYPIATKLFQGEPLLHAMLDYLLRAAPNGARLIGTGTSGAVIGTWLMLKSNYMLAYMHVNEQDFKATPISDQNHRSKVDGDYPNPKKLPYFIVDDLISSGKTISRILERLPKTVDTIEAVVSTTSYFIQGSSAFTKIQKTAYDNKVHLKNIVIL